MGGPVTPTGPLALRAAAHAATDRPEWNKSAARALFLVFQQFFEGWI